MRAYVPRPIWRLHDSAKPWRDHYVLRLPEPWLRISDEELWTRVFQEELPCAIYTAAGLLYEGKPDAC